MEVVVSSPSRDFDFEFNGARISPYLSAPSSPKRFGEYYLSAPTSPSRFSQFVSDFDYFASIDVDDDDDDAASSSDLKRDGGEDDDGFAFHVAQESEKLSLSAEELFDGGKIKAVKPPSRLGIDEFASSKSGSSLVARSKKAIGDAFSPKKETQERRGRDRTQSSTSTGRRTTRSHSPYRNLGFNTFEEEQGVVPRQQNQSSSSSSNHRDSLASTSANSKSSRKWRLRDFLLFRSASEGRGSSKDPLRKYSVLYKKPEEAKISSFRSVDSPNSSKRKGPISAHEMHYHMKKAESQDLKKKTFLPYRQGILGRLAGFGS